MLQRENKSLRALYEKGKAIDEMRKTIFLKAHECPMVNADYTISRRVADNR